MSAGDTPITITGNLTDDPDLRFTTSGIAVTAFTVAATRRTFDAGTGKWSDADTLFLRCSAWRQLAEHLAESVTKGTRVIVTGRLRQRDYETSDGQKRTAYEIDVDEAGPSLRYATAKVIKATRERPPHPAQADSDRWSAPQAGQPTEMAGAGSEPPF